MSKAPTFTEKETPFIAKAEQYCSNEERCRSAVMDKLLTWGAGVELSQRIIEHLISTDFINEGRYCRLYCDSKIRQQKWGRIKIAYQLRSKRIDAKTVDNALKTIDEEEYRAILTQVAADKMKSMTEPDPHKRDLKLAQYLASRGYEHTEINDAINNIKQTL